MSQDILWLIKNTQGRITGPLSPHQIIKLILNKELEGEETIALYPSGRWISIQAEPQFYKVFMDVLFKKNNTVLSHTSTHLDSELKDQDILSQTVIVSSRKLTSFKHKRKKKLKNKISQKTLIYPISDEYSGEIEAEILESKRKPKIRKRWIFIAFLLMGIASLFVLDNKETKSKGEYIRLKNIKKNQKKLSKKETEILIKHGFLQYLNSTVDSYIKAQNLLVQAIEGSPKNTYAMAILCLVYLELWPFSKQNYRSINVISKLIQKTSLLNKGGVKSGLCISVDLLIKGRYVDVKTMVESSLDGLSEAIKDRESQQMTLLFYYLKIRSMYYLQEDSMIMMSYLDSLQKSIPQWISPYMLTADIFLEQKNITQALSFYKKVIQKNPNNKTAKIQIGLIEYNHFNQTQKAENILKIALNNHGIVSSKIFSTAYYTLAKINIKKNNVEEALKYSRLAYSYNPAHEASRNLVLQLGGEKKLKQTQVKTSQLVYEGDQLVFKNKFKEAIGYYEEAFKIDKGKNARIAIKIAKNYWTLSFPDQAISWLKKAINTNSIMMESYVLMSEYYSEQYDFHNAEKILRIAFRKRPRSYELYRGKAYLAFKQQNYQQVIHYAQIALSIYEADIESYVILSESYAKLGDFNKSLIFATRGLEVDPNSIKTQVAYAKALGSTYGVETGESYLKKLVENYPLVIEYQMEWMKYLFQDEQYNSANKVILDIIKVNPSYKEAYFYLGRILMFNSDFRGAYEAFLQAAIFNPSTPLPTFYIGLLRLKEKKYNLAKTRFIKVLALNKFYPKAHYYLGKVAFFQKKYEEAIKQARLESRINPNLITPYLLVGESYEKLHRFKNCASAYQEAAEINPENMNIYVKIARCYRQSGHLDLAIKVLKKADGDDNVNRKSGDPLLYKELAIIYEIKGYYSESLSSYCNYLNLIPRAPDRKRVERRMRKLSQLTGKKYPNCG